MSEEEKVVEQEEVKPNYDDRAKMQGWVPKEEFKGDPERWISSEEFVKRADNMMPILKSVNKKYEGQIGTLSEELKQTKDTLNRIVSIQQKYSTDQYEARNSDLEARKLQAVQDGDTEQYNRLVEQQTKLPKPEPIAEPEKKTSQELERWKGDNPWFTEDPELHEYAMIISGQLANNNHPYNSPENAYKFGDVVKSKLEKMFPDKFKNPNKSKTDVDEPSVRGGETPPSNGKGWNDLPQEAKDYYNTTYKNIPGGTKERYIKDYFEA